MKKLRAHQIREIHLPWHHWGPTPVCCAFVKPFVVTWYRGADKTVEIINDAATSHQAYRRLTEARRCIPYKLHKQRCDAQLKVMFLNQT